MYFMPMEYQIGFQTTLLAITIFLLNHIEIASTSMSFFTLEIDLYSNQAKNLAYKIWNIVR